MAVILTHKPNISIHMIRWNDQHVISVPQTSFSFTFFMEPYSCVYRDLILIPFCGISVYTQAHGPVVTNKGPFDS